MGACPVARADTQPIGAFLYLSGVIYELIQFRDETRDRWSGLTAYHEVFRALDERSVDAETAQLLAKIRKRTAFHVKIDVAERVLPKVRAQPIAFMVSQGSRRTEMSYELADFVTFGFLFGHLDDLGKAHARFAEYFATLQCLVRDFLRRTDGVLLDRLRERGFRIEERPLGSYRAERSGSE